MSNYADRIKPDDCVITTYLEALLKKKYQIPTFQRNIVWEKDNVRKLWDSIYKFYPIGSILIWTTDIKLQNHRSISGHPITDDSTRTEYQYILDGQQRTNALLTSIYGGEIEGKANFDPTLYLDITIKDEDETDNDSYKKKFIFWNEIDDKNGKIKQNIGRKKRYDEGLIITLKDVKEDYSAQVDKLVKKGHSYDHPYWVQLRKIKEILDNYRISFIRLKGIQLSEVCQIFERVNVEGKPLDIFDIVVAKTYRPESITIDEPEGITIDKPEGTTADKPEGKKVEGFYLRELIDNFKEKIQGNFSKIDDLTLLQILAVFVNQKIPDSGIHNITSSYLSDIKATQIEKVWDNAKEALLKLFDFFDNHLHLPGPELIPFRYFYMTIASSFFENPCPDYDFLKKYFWFYSFHNDELLRNTTHLWSHIDFLNRHKRNEEVQFSDFLINSDKLNFSSYSSKGRLSRAILALLANQEPKDWKHPDRSVISEVYYLLTDKPNLHHIFPTNFVAQHPGENKLDSDSLMNIAYLPQITNLEISDENPIKYLKNYDNTEFTNVMKSHLMPDELLEWSRSDSIPENGLDIFIKRRTDLIIEKLRGKLAGIKFVVILDVGRNSEIEKQNE